MPVFACNCGVEEVVGFVEHYCWSSLVFTGEKEFKSLHLWGNCFEKILEGFVEHCCLSTLALAGDFIKLI